MFAFRRLISAQLERARAGLLRRASSAGSEGEVRISSVLQEKFPNAKQVRVVDVSGGCGAMYEVHVESEEFRGKRVVMQHHMINQALKDEIKGMHGLRIFTTVPEDK
ncbi:bolA-like protein 3 [Lethenteron reissneri]|uniref:bolA-like protein 3 n=1 Tax=Lethenteron reissneri TaxID=7753 RepID=UPI002AB7AA69|nr:bolA-like protein 3 [Lethenteron reissneri]